jgi:hypothetical protein
MELRALPFTRAKFLTKLAYHFLIRHLFITERLRRSNGEKYVKKATIVYFTLQCFYLHGGTDNTATDVGVNV